MVITIFHFIHYNRDVANVSLHGFHPRYLHLLVHLPFLFGPMLLTSTVMSVVKRPFSFFSSPLHWKTPHGWLGVSVLSGLLSLSWIPHQEPRFLLPLYPLLLLLCRPHPSLRRKYSFIVMSVLIMVSLSGHQAGLIPCLLKLNDLPWLPLLVTWHTYMVPHFLLPLMPTTTTTTTTSSWTSSRPPPSIQPMTLINLGSPPFPSSFPSPGNGTSHPPSFLHAFMKDPTHVPAFYFLAPFLPSTFPFSSSLSSSLSSMDPTVSSIPTDPKWYPEKVCTAYSISLDTPNVNEKHGYGVRLPFTTHVHLYRITQLNDSTQL
ncbi:hypothetical protein HMI55_004366 [Coelomomyces lativittatus]|nr:hypothetical protein HMI55_004366 [Coelomomyces lativittatus]